MPSISMPSMPSMPSKPVTSPFDNCPFSSSPAAPAPSLLSSIRALPSTPLPALTLGLAGLIPFAAAPAYMYNAGVFLPSVATAQLTYGATILAFLGGVRWGLLVRGDPLLPPSWGQYTWSVTPSLIAWASLLTPSLPAATSLCITGLTAAMVLDLRQAGYPAWFRGLRLLLTLGAVSSLVLSLLLSLGLGTRPQASDYLT